MTEEICKFEKIIQVKSKDRIILPKDVRTLLKIKEGDHIGFIYDGGPGLRIRKVTFEGINKD
jgi:AbrB family looped-hinge helix DNA binding protein